MKSLKFTLRLNLTVLAFVWSCAAGLPEVASEQLRLIPRQKPFQLQSLKGSRTMSAASGKAGGLK